MSSIPPRWVSVPLAQLGLAAAAHQSRGMRPQVDRDRRAEVGPVGVVAVGPALERVALADRVGDEEVLSGAGVELIGAAVVGYRVVAAGGGDDVVPRAVDEGVFGGAAGELVAAFAAEQDHGGRFGEAGGESVSSPARPARRIESGASRDGEGPGRAAADGEGDLAGRA